MENGFLTWRNAAGLLVILSTAALAGGYLGRLHPAGDLLAVGRVFAVMAVLITAVLANIAGMHMASFAATLFAMICGLQVFLAYFVPGPPGRFLVYQKNVLFQNAALADLEADIRAAGADAITLQEVSDANLVLLTNLLDIYPSQQICPGEGRGGPAVASTLPMVEGTGFCSPGLAAMQVLDEDIPLWIVSVHLQWPWPYGQATHLETLLPVLVKLEGAVIMGGDFNMVRWAHSVRALGEVTRTVAAGPTAGTYLGFDPWHRPAIDHVFAPLGGRTTLRGAFGSDHLGVLAQVEY